MKRVLCAVAAILMLLTTILTLPAGAATDTTLETTTGYPPTLHFYSQLPDKARQIYDALADEANLEALKSETPVVVASRELAFPTGINQAQYNALYDTFGDYVDALEEIGSELTNATAAFYRDRVEIFWTAGVRSRIAYLKNGELVSGDISLEPGNTYTAQLQVVLPLGEEWDGDSPSDRSLAQDIETLESNLASVIDAVEQTLALEGRAAAVEQINELLCRYNAYNSAALEDSFELRYPWTPLSALDQLSVYNDNHPQALKPVCEGYSKALKLICDRLEIPCVLVSGTGDGEDHMWNYVQVEDGTWYAVDATWNDSTGHDGYLLVGKDVMDQKHTTDSRFMKGEQMVFRYPVLATARYEAPVEGAIVTVEPFDPIHSGVSAYPTATIYIKNVGSTEIIVNKVTVEGSAFRLVRTGGQAVLQPGESTGEGEYLVSPYGSLAACVCNGTVTIEYTVGNDHTVKTASAPITLLVLPPEGTTPPEPGDEQIPSREDQDLAEKEISSSTQDTVGGLLPEKEDALNKVKSVFRKAINLVKSEPMTWVMIGILLIGPIISFLAKKK